MQRRTNLRRAGRIRCGARTRERRIKQGDALRRSRALVLERARLHCERCNWRVDHAHELEVHHLVPRSRAPRAPWLHDVSNLVALCAWCHTSIHAHAVSDWRRWLLTPADRIAHTPERSPNQVADAPQGGHGSFQGLDGARVTRSAVDLSCQVQSNFAPQSQPGGGTT